VSALLAFHNRHATSEEENVFVEEEEEENVTRINIFQKMRLDETTQKWIGAANLERFTQPLVTKGLIKDKMELIERVLGRSGSQANTVTNEIIKDMIMSTDYPPEVENIFLDINDVINAANELVEYVKNLQET